MASWCCCTDRDLSGPRLSSSAAVCGGHGASQLLQLQSRHHAFASSFFLLRCSTPIQPRVPRLLRIAAAAVCCRPVAELGRWLSQHPGPCLDLRRKHAVFLVVSGAERFLIPALSLVRLRRRRRFSFDWRGKSCRLSCIPLCSWTGILLPARTRARARTRSPVWSSYRWHFGGCLFQELQYLDYCFTNSLRMDGCDCIEPLWQADDLLMKYQYISDFFIALAYFSIPLELIYFVQKSAFFPYRWVLIQFGAFIVLCGATHLINMWTFTTHTRTIAVVLTVAKVATAVVSCITALMLVHIIPDLLSVKLRERFLKAKAEELDREMGIIRTQEETGRHVHMLTHEIRSTLDRHTILRTTLVEMGRTLGLAECAVWMLSRSGTTLQLSHALHSSAPLGSVVPINLPIIATIFNSNRAERIPHTSPLASVKTQKSKYVPPEVVAVRVPLLQLTNFQINDWPELSAKAFAVMVLMLPPDSARKWRPHELELVEVVADQVAVALSHAAILEESMRARDLLMEQNIALDAARREAEMAICARNDFLAVMNHEMRTPMRAIISLSSLLLETKLTAEQRVMIETILKSSDLLETLSNDVLDISKLGDGSLELEIAPFNLHATFTDVVDLIKPVAAVKRLSVMVHLAPELPTCAIGDRKRLMQIILNVAGNSVKFTKEGHISISASIARTYAPDFHPVLSDGSFYLAVQVKDTGCGISPQDMPHTFTKFAHPQNATNKVQNGNGLGLALSRRFVALMQGNIWLESEGVGKGCTATFFVKLGLSDKPNANLRRIVPPVQPKQGTADPDASSIINGDMAILPHRYHQSMI